MGKQIIAKGKTVKEAVSLALDLLDAGKDEVDIEILDYERKGMLGLQKKPAVVRVTTKEQKNSEPVNASAEISTETELQKVIVSLNLEDAVSNLPTESGEEIPLEEEDLCGKVWVRDGYIFCKDAPDKYPLISPGKGMKLYKNSILVEKTAIIQEDDILEVQLEDGGVEPRWELQVNDNKMQAILRVTPGYSMHRRLKDKAPGIHIQLEVEEHKTPISIANGPIMEKLKEAGIVHGVDYTEIARACVCDEAGSFIIAKGTPCTQGKHGSFKALQQVEIVKGLKERANGTIDYREIQQFPSVDRGQIVGIVIPPEPGNPGTTIANEPVFPPEVYPLTLQAGRGVELVEDGTKVVATDTGHPVVKIEGQLAHVSVIPKLLIGKDVSMKTGNIHYIGDVEILGSVQDEMSVEAIGNLQVHQNVNMARISAGSSIIVNQNIIASEVTAGRSSFLRTELGQILGELMEQMAQMITAINQLSTVSAFRVSSFTRTGLGPLLKILCDGKFKGFSSLIASLLKKIKSGEEFLEPEWIEFKEQVHRGFGSVGIHASELQSVDDIRMLLHQAEQLFASTQETDGENRLIYANFVHNSQLYSSGNIWVKGQGIYNSKLHAKGAIEIEGFVRGGELYAEKSVKIGEAGTKGVSTTKIIVPQSGTIRIKAVNEDTTIQVGTKTHIFMIKTYNVFARMNEAGELILS